MPESFEDEIKSLQRNHRVTEHPFVKRSLEGEASEEAIKVQVYQFYFHTVGFVKGLARLVSNCRVPELRKEIATGLYEEETGKLTGTAPHLELFFQYAEGWGINRDQLSTKAYMLPETSSLINWYMYASMLEPFIGIAVFNVAAEGVNITFPGAPGLSRLTADAMTQKYGRSRKEVEFWDLHDRADQEHSGTGVRILGAHAKSEEDRARVKTAIQMTKDAWWKFYDGFEAWKLEDCTRHNSAAFY
jgi:pyrroloquinoline-quinone synthase